MRERDAEFSYISYFAAGESAAAQNKQFYLPTSPSNKPSL